MHALTRCLACLALVAAAGCHAPKAGASVSCAPPECPADTTLQLVAEVEPPSDSPFVRQEFGVVGLDAQTGRFALTLDPQVTLKGVVNVATGVAAQSVPATVVATRASRISGRPDVYYQSTVNPTTGEYALVVPRNLQNPDGSNEQYALRVTVNDASLVPPKQIMVYAPDSQRVDFIFEDPKTLPELHGAVLDSLGNPVPGMQIQAMVPPDPANPTAPTMVVSTTVTSDGQGAYSLRLVKSPPPTVRLVAVPTTTATPRLPSLMLDVPTAKLAATGSPTVSLHMPALPAAAHVIYKVLGTGTSGALMPVMAASCVFSADVTDPHASDGTHAIYRATAMTDPLGQAGVDLISTDNGNRVYAVTVTPDASSSFGATTTMVTVATQGGYGESIMLALRPQLSGRALDPQGHPLRNLQVVPGAATVAAALGPTPFVVTTTPPQTLADVDGRFALRLDRGAWDIGLIPPADSMLPRLWLANTVVQSDVDLGSITVPRGVMVHGLVHDPIGVPLARATVRLYTVAAGNSTCSGADKNQCLAPPRLRAEGSSAADGLVTLILPSQPD